MTPASALPASEDPDLPPADRIRLAELLRAHAPYDGSFDLRIPGMHVTRTSRIHKELVHGVLNAMVRLMELVGQPGEADLLAPLVLDEILIRLLRSPLGPRVALIGQEESRIQRVAQAVTWVRTHFDQPLDVERLATLVHMSPSSFHQHFKAVTSMSPLQYQKALRLQEARRFMLMTLLDAGTAGRRVGYQSPSQFTREYSRYFGSAPTRDIARLRERAGPPEAALSD